MGEEDINIQNEIIDFIKENDKNMEISFLVSNSLPKVKTQLKQQFEEQLKEIAKELNLKIYSEPNLRISFYPSQWTKHAITFRYEQRGIIYGITLNEVNKDIEKLPEIEEYLKNEIQLTFNYSGGWPLWQFFYKNIEIEPQFYIDIINGNAKKRARKFIELLINGNFNTDL
jgi:archaellum component FlaC